MFGDVRKVLVGGAALLALLPTAGFLAALASFPPEFDKFLAFTVGVTGPVALLLCFILRTPFLRLRLRVRLALIGLTLACGSWAAWESYAYGVRHVVEVQFRGDSGEVEMKRFVKPEHPTGRLARILDREFSGRWDYAVVDPDFGNEVRLLMRDQSLPTQRKLVVLVNLAQALLIFTLLGAAFIVADTMARRSPRPESDRR